VPRETEPDISALAALDRVITMGISLSNCSLSNNRWVGFLFFVFISVVGFARAFIGLTGTRLYSHDAFALLDPAWRVLNGQVSHVDFFDNLGPVAYFPTAVGLLIAGGKANGFAIGQSLCSVGFGYWTYLLSRNRLFDFGRVVLSAVVVLTAAAPFALGDSSIQISPAMTYNRYGYAFIALILLEALVKPKSPRSMYEFVGGFSTGSALVLLIFMKITFFFGAAFLVLALITCRTQVKVRWTGLLSGVITALLLFSIYFRFDFQPMWHDLTILAGAKHIKRSDYAVESILGSAGLLLVFTISVALLCYGRKKLDVARIVLISGGAACVAGLLLIFTNFERIGFPLQAIVPIFLVDASNQTGRPESRIEKSFHLCILVWSSALILTLLIPSAISLSYGVAHKVIMGDQYQPLQSPRLAGFVAVREDESYQIFVNDGIALLKRYIKPKDSVMSLDFSNPFSFGLGLSPARGGAIALQYGTTFNEFHKPEPEWLFGYATLVMVPKKFLDFGNENILRLYGPYLNLHFQLIAESAQWRLYRNRLHK